jgi:signal transduction histidine kinase
LPKNWSRKTLFALIFLICFLSNGLASFYYAYVVYKAAVVDNFASRAEQSTTLIRKALEDGDYTTYIIYTKKFFSTVDESIGIRLTSKLDQSEIIAIEMDGLINCPNQPVNKVITTDSHYHYCQIINGILVQISQKKKDIPFFQVNTFHLLVSILTALLCATILIITMRAYFSHLILKLESFLENISGYQDDDDFFWLRKPILNLFSAIESLSSKLVEKEKAQALAKNVRQVTHDLGGPISALSVISDKLTSTQSDLAPLTKSTLDRLTSLSRELKSRSDINTEALESFDSTRIEHIFKELSLQYEDEGVEFKIINHTTVSGQVFGSQKIFYRVLACLIQNAVDALNKNSLGVIEMTLRESDIHVEVDIKDNGQGIKEENLESITLPGVSIGKENIKASGMGLGLSFAIEKIEDWGGIFNIESEYGAGTTVHMKLLKATNLNS